MICKSVRTRLAGMIIAFGSVPWLGAATFLFAMWCCVRMLPTVETSLWPLLMGYVAVIQFEVRQIKRKLDGMS